MLSGSAQKPDTPSPSTATMAAQYSPGCAETLPPAIFRTVNTRKPGNVAVYNSVSFTPPAHLTPS